MGSSRMIGALMLMLLKESPLFQSKVALKHLKQLIKNDISQILVQHYFIHQTPQPKRSLVWIMDCWTV